MKLLMIMRHAKSSWSDQSLSDHDRPLNARGLETAPKMGQFTAKHGCLPNLILSSTASRAVATAELFIEGCGVDIPLAKRKSLYHPSINDFREALRTMTSGEERVMVVSHNPGSEEWVYELTNQFEKMPTGAIAMIEFDEKFEWTDFNKEPNGKLVSIWRPKEVL